ncbi:MAG: 50S ribosomal protein L21 [Pseudomonadota bacterium]|nr:50S ribosomal protein L21 [Pseudomonadota bacterium]
MQAIIKSGGHQYRVAAGTKIAVDSIVADVGSEVEFADVLATMPDADNGAGKGRDNSCQFGTPYLTGVVVKGKVVAQARRPKVVIFKYKRRKNYKRTRGWRQSYTEVEITSVANQANQANS